MSGIAFKKLISNVSISVNSHFQTNPQLTKIFQCSINTISSEGELNIKSIKKNINNHKPLENINKNEIVIDYLRSSKIKYCQGWNTFNLYVCSQAEDSFHLNKNTGEFYCLKCNKHGGFEAFKKISNSVLRDKKSCKDVQIRDVLEDDLAPNRNVKYLKEWNESEPISSISESHLKIVLKSAHCELDFKKDTLSKHNIRIYESMILYPIHDTKNNNRSRINDLLVLNMNADEQKLNRADCVIAANDSLANSKTSSIYITDSVLNMLTLNDRIKNASAIVVNSASALNQYILTLLESFNQIIFWQKDKHLSYELAKYLNINRCFMISSSRSAYESICNNENLDKIIKEKFHLKEKSIIQFDHLKTNIFSELSNSKTLSGLQWTRFPQLNEILKGHRPGELTIFTGPTGSGKTTFLSEYSLDLCMQGLTTLWGSFEIKNHRLAKIMMTQYAKLNLHKNIRMFNYIEKQFSTLPIYFMDFHGEQTVDNVIEIMSKSVILYDVKHIIIDNLQFMIGCQYNNSIEKFYLQDIMIGLFRRFATNFDCHITLVIHPRKEENNEPLKTASIFGTAKASQEADNILILQDQKVIKNDKIVSSKYIEITKNRFDGELGKFGIKFEKDILSFVPTSSRSTYSRASEILDLNEVDLSDTNLNIKQ